MCAACRALPLSAISRVCAGLRPNPDPDPEPGPEPGPDPGPASCPRPAPLSVRVRVSRCHGVARARLLHLDPDWTRSRPGLVRVQVWVERLPSPGPRLGLNCPRFRGAFSGLSLSAAPEPPRTELHQGRKTRSEPGLRGQEEPAQPSGF